MSRKLVFLTDILSHYQLSLSEEFIRIYGNGYLFIATEPFHQEMIDYGVKDLNQKPFVMRTYESTEIHAQAMKEAEESECLIICGIPVDAGMVQRRAEKGKITFLYSERPLKPVFRDRPVLEAVRKIKRIAYARFMPRRNESLMRRLAGSSRKFFLLCSGAFVAHDFRLMGLFNGSAYRWGYFPAMKNYDSIEALIARKNPASILWAGRCISWKHPEYAVRVAANLRDKGANFNMKIIGSGEMLDTLRGMIDAMNLGGYVELAGSMPPDSVRKEMESSQIFLFTSDSHEGWGCVLNEAMNSGCAVIAGEKIGAVSYLIQHGHNGIIFRDKDIDGLTRITESLLNDSELSSRLGREAYMTVAGEWNPKTAAERFAELSADLARGGEGCIFTEGPCSPAPLMRDSWFRNQAHNTPQNVESSI
ncbi:MAG: glycosyltransferase [Synergistaceae bacterium]|nr:glycosyltransferase [Synergistaceae bacterium]